MLPKQVSTWVDHPLPTPLNEIFGSSLVESTHEMCCNVQMKLQACNCHALRILTSFRTGRPCDRTCTWSKILGLRNTHWLTTSTWAFATPQVEVVGSANVVEFTSGCVVETSWRNAGRSEEWRKKNDKILTLFQIPMTLKLIAAGWCGKKKKSGEEHVRHEGNQHRCTVKIGKKFPLFQVPPWHLKPNTGFSQQFSRLYTFEILSVLSLVYGPINYT